MIPPPLAPLLAVPALLAAALAAPAGEDVRTVAVGFPEAAAEEFAAVLEVPLAAAAPGVGWRFDPVPADRLAEVLEEATGHRVVAVVGYPLPLLRELALAGRLAYAPPCAAARPDAGAPDRTHALWFDPVLLAWSDGGTGVDARPSWVPERLSELCEGGVDGRLLMARATPWNATGALVTSLAGAGGDEDDVEGRLVGLDGNRAEPYLEREQGVLRRLAGLEPGPVGVVSRASLHRFRLTHPDAAGLVHALAPRDRVAAVLLGAAALETEDAAPLFERMGHPRDLADLSRAAALVPLADGAGGAPLPADAAGFRAVVAGELPRLAREQALARATVDRYVHEIVGRHEGREALYSEVFDALGVAAMAAFVFWLLRRRDGAARDAPPGHGPGPSG